MKGNLQYKWKKRVNVLNLSLNVSFYVNFTNTDIVRRFFYYISLILWIGAIIMHIAQHVYILQYYTYMLYN